MADLAALLAEEVELFDGVETVTVHVRTPPGESYVSHANARAWGMRTDKAVGEPGRTETARRQLHVKASSIPGVTLKARDYLVQVDGTKWVFEEGVHLETMGTRWRCPAVRGR